MAKGGRGIKSSVKTTMGNLMEGKGGVNFGPAGERACGGDGRSKGVVAGWAAAQGTGAQRRHITKATGASSQEERRNLVFKCESRFSPWRDPGRSDLNIEMERNGERRTEVVRIEKGRTGG